MQLEKFDKEPLITYFSHPRDFCIRRLNFIVVVLTTTAVLISGLADLLFKFGNGVANSDLFGFVISQCLVIVLLLLQTLLQCWDVDLRFRRSSTAGTAAGVSVCVFVGLALFLTFQLLNQGPNDQFHGIY